MHAITGKRLPIISDRSSLPYLAVHREVMRWRPVLFLVVRRAVDDDVLNGYFIPKGMHICIRAVPYRKSSISFLRRHRGIYEHMVKEYLLAFPLKLTRNPKLIGWITCDPALYSEPEEFRPERFFDANGKLNNDNTPVPFGLGRR